MFKGLPRGVLVAGFAACGACTTLLGIDENYQPSDSGSGSAASGGSGSSSAGVAGAGGIFIEPPPACDDGERNGSETDVDCGGACLPCAAGRACGFAEDCTTLSCADGVCQEATCSDGAKNGEETGVDCGGHCPAQCALLEGCLEHDDCQSGVCLNGLCQNAACNDPVQNGDETDLNCGGGTCAPCAPGRVCITGSRDCESRICDGGVCAAPTCTDGHMNGSEADIDCGGACPACKNGSMCKIGDHCDSGFCISGICRDPCTDGVRDGDESSVDCGGPRCPTCPCGRACSSLGDCDDRAFFCIAVCICTRSP